MTETRGRTTLPSYRAARLRASDLVLTSDGRAAETGGLDSSNVVRGTAFSLTLRDIHTYFVQVGNVEVLVHNTCAWPVQVGGNCSACFSDSETLEGDQTMRLKPTRGTGPLGPSVNNPTGSGFYQDVVVRDGVVFDAFTEPSGMPMANYLRQVTHADAITMVAP